MYDTKEAGPLPPEAPDRPDLKKEGAVLPLKTEPQEKELKLSVRRRAEAARGLAFKAGVRLEELAKKPSPQRKKSAHFEKRWRAFQRAMKRREDKVRVPMGKSNQQRESALESNGSRRRPDRRRKASTERDLSATP